MEAKELRIKNLVTDQFGEVCTVDTINPQEIFNAEIGEIPIYCVLPIPLTEKWMLKLGFFKTYENAGNLECFKQDNITVANWIGGKWQVWIDTKDLRNSPQYVHQLQNLHFALTGKELKYEI